MSNFQYWFLIGLIFVFIFSHVISVYLIASELNPSKYNKKLRYLVSAISLTIDIVIAMCVAYVGSHIN